MRTLAEDHSVKRCQHRPCPRRTDRQSRAAAAGDDPVCVPTRACTRRLRDSDSGGRARCRRRGPRDFRRSVRSAAPARTQVCALYGRCGACKAAAGGSGAPSSQADSPCISGTAACGSALCAGHVRSGAGEAFGVAVIYFLARGTPASLIPRFQLCSVCSEPAQAPSHWY